jgi:hypothetical protein
VIRKQLLVIVPLGEGERELRDGHSVLICSAQIVVFSVACGARGREYEESEQ